MKKGFASKICLIVCVAVVLCMFLYACDSNTTTPPPPASTTPKPTSVVCVDINPSIELVLDQFDVVMSIGSANDDARVLLWQENGIVGTDVDVALMRILSIAKDMNFVAEQSTISLSVQSSTKDEAELFATLQQQIENAASQQGIGVQIVDTLDIVLQFELQNLIDNQIVSQDVSLQQFHLAKRISELNADTSLQDALQMDTATLVSLLLTAQSQVTNTLGTAYTQAVQMAQANYDIAYTLANDMAYIRFFAQRIAQPSLDFTQKFADMQKLGYAVDYVGNKISRIATQSYVDFLTAIKANPIFGYDAFINFAASLGVSEQEAQSYFASHTEDNMVSAQNVRSFVNTLYRNSSASQREQIKNNFPACYETMVDDFRTILAHIAENAQANIQDLVDTFSQNDELAVDKSEFDKLNIGGIFDSLSSIFDIDVEFCKDYSDLEMLKATIDNYDQKTALALVNMALTDHDIEQINALQKENQSLLKSAEDARLQAVEEARNTAIELFSSRKDERK